MADRTGRKGVARDESARPMNSRAVISGNCIAICIHHHNGPRHADGAGGASPLPAVQALINLARNNGTSSGPSGLTSSAARDYPSCSTTLGAMESAEHKKIASPPALFHGLALDDDAVLVKYTYYGDAKFDERMTFDDYVKVDTGFAQHRAGWSNGGFNADGAVNLDDQVLVEIAFNSQSGALPRLSMPRRAIRG
jgi:hypothetical protein